MIGSKVWFAAAIASAFIVSGAASAQGNLKIGVINVARLIEQSPQSESVRLHMLSQLRSVVCPPMPWPPLFDASVGPR